jgi:hypothetical protein|tara:strand:+ start:17 stop:157 length:141 start_codon:yes stop_codon:yes gene_type:complete
MYKGEVSPEVKIKKIEIKSSGADIKIPKIENIISAPLFKKGYILFN